VETVKALLNELATQGIVPVPADRQADTDLRTAVYFTEGMDKMNPNLGWVSDGDSYRIYGSGSIPLGSRENFEAFQAAVPNFPHRIR
jgi:hypothetical protein